MSTEHVMTITNTEAVSDERLAETCKRLQEILDYFDEEANEALANETERGDLWSDIEIPVADLRTLLALSRRAANSAGGVEVKALEWHGPDVNGDRHATSILGTYTIRKQQGSMGFWLTQVGGYHRTVADAEAAAQSDYNRRILLALTHPSSSVSAEVTDAARDVLAERQRQVEAEGWTPKHDDEHQRGEMAGAAACYALRNVQHWGAAQAAASLWPWDEKWWKPSDNRRNLVKAGALIIAEIERLDRLSALNGKE